MPIVPCRSPQRVPLVSICIDEHPVRQDVVWELLWKHNVSRPSGFVALRKPMKGIFVKCTHLKRFFHWSLILGDVHFYNGVVWGAVIWIDGDITIEEKTRAVRNIDGVELPI